MISRNSLLIGLRYHFIVDVSLAIVLVVQLGSRIIWLSTIIRHLDTTPLIFMFIILRCTVQIQCTLLNRDIDSSRIQRRFMVDICT